MSSGRTWDAFLMEEAAGPGSGVKAGPKLMAERYDGIEYRRE